MTQQQRDWYWLDAGEAIGMTELAQACGVTIGELQELVEYGAVHPAVADDEQQLFTADCVMPLRTAFRLRRDYDLDLFTVALLLEQLQRIDDLERQLGSLRAHLPSLGGGALPHDAPGTWREPHGKGRG
jgi:chaperone modulatory protein CbpM